MNRQEKEAAEALELYVVNDRQMLERVRFAFRHVSLAVDRAAETQAKERADWHDDPDGDPTGHAECHAPASEQFSTEARAAVVVALFGWCERVRQEDIENTPAKVEARRASP